MTDQRRRLNVLPGLRTGVFGLNILAWIRRQPWLQSIYRLFPQALRDRLSTALAARAVAQTRFKRTAAWDFEDRALPPQRAGISSDAQLSGVNIIGYIRGEFGLAESARMYARALINEHVPLALCDVDLGMPHSWGDHSLAEFIDERLPYSVSIVFVNPDYLEAALDYVGRTRMAGRYVIACWFWELEKIPQSWLPAIQQVDEIMVASRFIENAFQQVTNKPILRIPLPLSEIHDSGLQRRDFGLEPDKFIFLCTFDFHSYIARKNPYAAIHAFLAAFPAERDDVRLLVKSSNGHLHPDGMRELLNAVGSDRRISVRDEVINRAHICALQRCCDAYVSLHRAEGFGLGLAECMALGKPVIATGWSGNAEFMNSGNSCLVDYELVPVRVGEYPHSIGAYWAEADLASAASAMRWLADDPARARSLGEMARQDVYAHLSPKQAARRLMARVAEVNAGLTQ